MPCATQAGASGVGSGAVPKLLDGGGPHKPLSLLWGRLRGPLISRAVDCGAACAQQLLLAQGILLHLHARSGEIAGRSGEVRADQEFGRDRGRSRETGLDYASRPGLAELGWLMGDRGEIVGDRTCASEMGMCSVASARMHRLAMGDCGEIRRDRDCEEIAAG